MPQVVSAIVTDRWRNKSAALSAGDTVTFGAFSVPTTFKIGEGGWASVGGVLTPVAPVSSLTDLTAGTGVYTTTDYIFTKPLQAADLTYTSPNRLEIRCTVLTSEGNGPTGVPRPPSFFELGIFDALGHLLIYSTFPMEVKTDSRALQHTIYVDF